ncbi:MAG: S8 family serine peptidase [Planctomycetes bacterium]|nr:S8 family serine peptidase [Planctomycetota bacterium]
MRSNHVISQVGRFALVVLAAGLLVPSGAVRADDDDGTTEAGRGGAADIRRAKREVVVYVNDESDLAAAKASCAAEMGTSEPTEIRSIRGRNGKRGRALVYRFAAEDDSRAACRAERRVRGDRGVSDALMNRPRRTKGAPSQIPVLDGDLEPRVIYQQPAMAQIGIAAAQRFSRGGGVLVAVIDGAFDLRHEFLGGRLHPVRFDALSHDDDPQDLGNGIDDDGDGVTDSIRGHGTFTASLILAAAPDATILPIRVLDDEGWGTPLAVAEAIDFAIQQGAKVINMSLVIPTATPMVRDAVQAALDAGIVVVSAAGNNSGTGPTWQNDPQLVQRVINVGAVDETDTLASFTNSGPMVHVYAPGVGIEGALGGPSSNEYGRWQGTSFAAPFVAGTAAIVRGVAPVLPSLDVRRRVVETAAPVAGAGPSRGRLNAAATLAAVTGL